MTFKCDVSTREKPCEYAPAVKINLVQDLERPYLHFKQIDLIKDKIVLDQVVSLCMFHTATIDMFIKIIIDSIKKNINFNIACPFKKVSLMTSHCVRKSN